jgi:3-oxoacyl-[acyl-carrier-protein] synthase-3
MEGLRVYRSSADKMLEAAAEVLTRADLNLSDIDYFLPHQANLRLLHFLEEKLPGPVMLSSLQTLGNTSSASVFCGLDRSLRSGTLRAASDSRPTRILVAVYGAGATWGAAILELSSKFIRSYQESTKVRSKP